MASVAAPSGAIASAPASGELNHILRLVARAIAALRRRGILTHCCVCGHTHVDGGSGVVDELGGMIIVAVCTGCPTRNLFATAGETERWLLGLHPPADYIRIPEDRGAFAAWLEELAGAPPARVTIN